ncbi:8-amino-7-oxononanoate synthase [Qipengyuania spongiae]|uniref:8-amino-7-oxononanoate synthase n=1 Tax=Qipengyuania spongiae TaxID=2909673 RepID=A0ABY5SYX5_9SPHN|nr:8-amino-7-oxononanoate synthase [Qipengyuania spongiae]UVI39056.1 8-amino-7-oxononanoate synthase [Qipengyuania spongiae]
MSVPNFYIDDLDALDRVGRRRTLTPSIGLDFSSNDYLGLANSGLLRQAARAALDRGVGLGSGGSRLLRGNTSEHEKLEHFAADLFGSEAVLFVGSGFAANSLIFSTLPQPDDLIVHDALIHASAHEGMRLSRASNECFAHNDVGAAEAVIRKWRAGGGKGTTWLAFETLYSMDGDVAPVADFAALAERTGAMLVIDEAHAVGVLGKGGRGLAAGLHEQENVIVLATCGKALGCEGGLILCSTLMREFLINRGRAFIFSTAPSSLIAAVVRESLAIMALGEERRDRLRALVRHAGNAFGVLGVIPSGSQIQPIVIGDDVRTMRVAAGLQARGFDVRGIRPPTVPPGTARLRVSITLNVDEQAIDGLAAAAKDLLATV